jgi:hypothetical protein
VIDDTVGDKAEADEDAQSAVDDSDVGFHGVVLVWVKADEQESLRVGGATFM